MSDYLSEAPTAPTDSNFLGGEYSDPSTGDGYLGSPEAGGYVESAPQPIQYASQQNFEPAPIMLGSQHNGGNLTVQAPFLDEVRPSRNTVGGTQRDLSTLLLDVEVPVEVYFGDAALTVEEFLDLGPGSVVELDHTIEAPIELRVRGKLVATGQLVTINGNFGLRITSTVEKH